MEVHAYIVLKTFSHNQWEMWQTPHCQHKVLITLQRIARTNRQIHHTRLNKTISNQDKRLALISFVITQFNHIDIVSLGSKADNIYRIGQDCYKWYQSRSLTPIWESIWTYNCLRHNKDFMLTNEMFVTSDIDYRRKFMTLYKYELLST